MERFIHHNQSKPKHNKTLFIHSLISFHLFIPFCYCEIHCKILALEIISPAPYWICLRHLSISSNLCLMWFRKTMELWRRFFRFVNDFYRFWNFAVFFSFAPLCVCSGVRWWSSKLWFIAGNAFSFGIHFLFGSRETFVSNNSVFNFYLKKKICSFEYFLLPYIRYVNGSLSSWLICYYCFIVYDFFWL